MQKRVSTLPGGCRGIRKGFPEKGRQESNLEAEQAGARQAGEGGLRCGQREQLCTGHRAREGPRVWRNAKRLLGQEHSILTAEGGR